MANSLGDLNNHLFNQLERLGNGDLSAEQIEQEVQRADAIVKISDQVTRTADLSLKAAKLYAEHGQHVLEHLPQIAASKDE